MNRHSSLPIPHTPAPLPKFGGRIQAAAELAIPLNDGAVFFVEGSTPIARLPPSPAGLPRRLIFLAACTLLASASLITPGQVNLSINAGDIIDAVPGGDGVWRAYAVAPASGGARFDIPQAWSLAQKAQFAANAGQRTQATTTVTYYVGTAPVTVTISNGSPGNITWAGNTLLANDPVSFSTSGALPTGLSPGVVYYVKTAGNPFTVSATPGGAAINTSSAGSGTHKAWTGNDTTGDGSSAKPFMTLQAAYDYAFSNLDQRGFFLTLQVRAAYQFSSSYVLDAYGGITGQINSARCVILGDTTTPANVVLEGGIAAVQCEAMGAIEIQGLRLKSSGGLGLNATTYGWVTYTSCEFDVCGTAHRSSSKYGITFDGGGCNIVGDSPRSNYITDTGMGIESTGTTTITGARTWSSAYCVCDEGGTFIQHTKTYTILTSATGKRFQATNGSNLGMETQTKLPGNAAGTLDETSVAIFGDSSDPTALYPGWSSYTPVLTAASGSISTSSVTGTYKVDKANRVCHVTGKLVVSANTAVNWLNLTLPVSSAADGVGRASWDLTGPGSISMLISVGGTANLVKYDGAVPTGTGTIKFSASYPI